MTSNPQNGNTPPTPGSNPSGPPKRPTANQRIAALQRDTDALKRDTVTLGKANQHFLEMIETLAVERAQDASALNALKAKFEKLDEVVNDKAKQALPVKYKLAISGFTPDEVKTILSLQEQDQIDLDTVITGVIATLDKHRADLDAALDTIADTRGIVNAHAQRLDKNDSRLDEHDTRFNGLDHRLDMDRKAFYADLTASRTTIENNVYGNVNNVLADPKAETTFAGWTFPVAIGAFLFFLLMFGKRVFDVGLNLSGGTGPKHADLANPWWVGTGFGLVAAAIIVLAGKMTVTRFSRLRSQPTAAPQAQQPAPVQPPANPRNGNDVGRNNLDPRDGQTQRMAPVPSASQPQRNPQAQQPVRQDPPQPVSRKHS